MTDIDGNKAMNELKTKGCLTFNFDGSEVILTEEDLLIEAAQMEGYVSDTEYDVTVVLDTNLTPELIEEGFVRELISKIQTMRKEAGFEVMDHIIVGIQGNEKIEAIVRNNEETLKSEVLSEAISYDQTEGYTKEWSINGENVNLSVMKIG